MRVVVPSREKDFINEKANFKLSYIQRAPRNEISLA